MKENPFPINRYEGPDFFCDRQAETAAMLEAIENGRSITLHSIRRLGKTALIQHVFHMLSSKNAVIPIYLDIFDITSPQDFLNLLSSKIIGSIEKSQDGFIKRITKYFGKYRPVFSVDTLSGNPSVSLDIKNDEDIIYSLDLVFSIAQEQRKKLIIAIDEFQQINHFDLKTIPATLRKYMQTSGQILFIFSGSQRELLLNITASPKQALYRSTQMLPLGRIEEDIFYEFILQQFKKSKRKIDFNVISDGLRWTMRHTYYTQYYFNRLFSVADSSIDADTAQKIKDVIIRENQVVFHNYKNLMTKAQWKLLVALGKENQTLEPTSQSFLRKYQLGAHSTVRRSIQSLVESEMIYYDFDPESGKNVYKVYDVFLSRWLERM